MTPLLLGRVEKQWGLISEQVLVSEQAIEALARMRPNFQAASALHRIMSSDAIQESVRHAAADALAEIGRDALSMLMAALNSDDVESRAIAVYALARVALDSQEAGALSAQGPSSHARAG